MRGLVPKTLVEGSGWTVQRWVKNISEALPKVQQLSAHDASAKFLGKQTIRCRD